MQNDSFAAAARGVGIRLAYGLAFEFATAPTELVTFERSDDTLCGSRSGSAVITTAGGCTFSRHLPFRVALAAAREAATDPKHTTEVH